MLYEVELPEETRELLSELVEVQQNILEATLEIFSLGITDWKDNFRDLLEMQLNKSQGFDRHHSDVADWVCDKPKVVGFLHSFAEGYEGASLHDRDLHKEKQWLLSAMRHDINCLTNNGVASFEVYLNEKSGLPTTLLIARQFITKQTIGRVDKRPDWLKALADYLLYFYNDLGSQTGIQAGVFRHRTENYGRQDFLKAYRAKNHKLAVCPMCDNAAFLTVSSSGHYHADIDHYFPKDIYPHLAVHPYNLIPVCKLCNQAIKRDIDLLSPDHHGDNRYSLSDIFLPYRKNRALSEASLLRINSIFTADGIERTDADFIWHERRDGSKEKGPLKSARVELRVKATDGRDLTNHFKLFSRIYDIPGRWEQQIDEIFDMFFRRIRQLFADNVLWEPDSLDSFKLIENKLNWFLAFLDETSGSDRYTLLMKWWLAELVVRYVNQGASPSKNPLLEEIQSWKNDFENKRESYTQRVVAITSEIRNVMQSTRQ